MATNLLAAPQGRNRMTAAIAAAFSLAVAPGAEAATYAPWLTQIGVSDAILSAANWGKNQLLGVVDTGIVAGNPSFAPGQVSNALSSCAAVTFKCPNNGFADDNGHGTAVAAIAAGNLASPFSSAVTSGGYAVSPGAVISVAPDANIVAEKAADAGASVINVSITYGNSADIVAAINYAAGKGAFIVWAGGNDGRSLLTGASTAGLTAAAVTHLVFAGSVNSRGGISSFSNTPGAGLLVDASGAKTSYAARWAMAPGEGILAPYTPLGAGWWASWSGTSMSTPIISGSLILLESAWPILKTNGTAANLLLATTSDLGAKGTDATYGTGLVNLATAFKPYGPLTVTQANGQSVPVSGITGALLSSGALGNLAALQGRLAAYTAFDGYLRNFTVNLSGLIKSPAMAATTNPLPTNVNTGPAKIKLAGGAELAWWQAPAASPLDRLGVFGFNADRAPAGALGAAMLTDGAGNTAAFGHGVPVQFAYAQALYGNGEAARQSTELGASNLAALAQGGNLFAYGARLSETTRVALSWSSTSASPAGPAGFESPAWAVPAATNASFGVTQRFGERVTGGVVAGLLSESHGLLGSTYDAGSALNLGASNRTASLGASATIRLDHRASLMVEAAVASTRGMQGAGLIAGTGEIRSRAFGASFMSTDLLQSDDRLLVSVRQPLRVVAGRMGVATSTVDEQGVAQLGTEWVSLVPTGRETDYTLSYDVKLGRDRTFFLQAGVRRDAMNVRGADDARLGATWVTRF